MLNPLGENRRKRFSLDEYQSRKINKGKDRALIFLNTRIGLQEGKENQKKNPRFLVFNRRYSKYKPIGDKMGLQL
jgi:hypothetical protein